jgi:hypothetical protein
MSTENPDRPPVCANCWNVHRATKPRLDRIYCPHLRVAVRLFANGTWQVQPDVDRADGATLRRCWLRAGRQA